METDIRTLAGVISVSVILDPEGTEIDEIHIVSTCERSPKQLVRDVETLILGNHGVRIDHKKISIAQVRDVDLDAIVETDESRDERTRPSRIRFVSTKSNSYGLRWEVAVELERGGIPSAATVNGAGSRKNKARLVAQATAEALNNYLGEKQAVAVDEVQINEGIGYRTAVVILTLLGDRAEKVLVGSSIMDEDMPKAVVHATLDAVNRALT